MVSAPYYFRTVSPESDLFPAHSCLPVTIYCPFATLLLPPLFFTPFWIRRTEWRGFCGFGVGWHSWPFRRFVLLFSFLFSLIYMLCLGVSSGRDDWLLGMKRLRKQPLFSWTDNGLWCWWFVTVCTYWLSFALSRSYFPPLISYWYSLHASGDLCPCIYLLLCKNKAWRGERKPFANVERKELRGWIAWRTYR